MYSIGDPIPPLLIIAFGIALIGICVRYGKKMSRFLYYPISILGFSLLPNAFEEMNVWTNSRSGSYLNYEALSILVFIVIPSIIIWFIMAIIYEGNRANATPQPKPINKYTQYTPAVYFILVILSQIYALFYPYWFRSIDFLNSSYAGNWFKKSLHSEYSIWAYSIISLSLIGLYLFKRKINTSILVLLTLICLLISSVFYYDYLTSQRRTVNWQESKYDAGLNIKSLINLNK